MNKYLQVMEACRYLARQCDGARKQDNAGFNGADTFKGHKLAAASLATGWTQREMADAVWMLQKYRRQLSEVGLDLPKPREVSLDTWQVFISVLRLTHEHL